MAREESYISAENTFTDSISYRGNDRLAVDIVIGSIALSPSVTSATLTVSLLTRHHDDLVGFWRINEQWTFSAADITDTVQNITTTGFVVPGQAKIGIRTGDYTSGGVTCGIRTRVI